MSRNNDNHNNIPSTIRTGLMGSAEDRDNEIEAEKFQFKMLAFLRYIIESSTKYAALACRCRSGSKVSDDDMVLALKYVSKCWGDTPNLEEKINSYFVHEVLKDKKSLSYWFDQSGEDDSESEWETASDESEEGAEEAEGTEEKGEREENSLQGEEGEDGRSTESMEVDVGDEESEEDFAGPDGPLPKFEYCMPKEESFDYSKHPVTSNEREFYNIMTKVASTWDDWNPEDDISTLLKKAVHGTVNQTGERQKKAQRTVG